MTSSPHSVSLSSLDTSNLNLSSDLNITPLLRSPSSHSNMSTIRSLALSAIKTASSTLQKAQDDHDYAIQKLKDICDNPNTSESGKLMAINNILNSQSNSELLAAGIDMARETKEIVKLISSITSPLSDLRLTNPPLLTSTLSSPSYSLRPNINKIQSTYEIWLTPLSNSPISNIDAFNIFSLATKSSPALINRKDPPTVKFTILSKEDAEKALNLLSSFTYQNTHQTTSLFKIELIHNCSHSFRTSAIENKELAPYSDDRGNTKINSLKNMIVSSSPDVFRSPDDLVKIYIIPKKDANNHKLNQSILKVFVTEYSYKKILAKHPDFTNITFNGRTLRIWEDVTITLCNRCQRSDHHIKNCPPNLPPRCRFCLSNHDSVECCNSSTPRCCNCYEYNVSHIDNYDDNIQALIKAEAHQTDWARCPDLLRQQDAKRLLLKTREASLHETSLMDLA